MKKAVKCTGNFDSKAASDMMRFASWGGRIADDLADWLDQSAKRFHVGEYLSQEEIDALIEATEILLDAKMMIIEDIRRN